MTPLPSRNVLGGPLKPCSLDPLTGFFRNGRCDTCREDHGCHTVCVEVTQEFLDASFLNNFERHLSRNGTLILKFFLHLSKSEQKKRFLERLTHADKYWKVSPSDMGERKFWSEYQEAFESAISATSTKWAPWYVIPADRKYVARALVADIVVGAINGLDLKYPTVSPEAMKALVAARKELEGDGKEPKARKRKRSQASGRV